MGDELCLFFKQFWRTNTGIFTCWPHVIYLNPSSEKRILFDFLKAF